MICIRLILCRIKVTCRLNSKRCKTVILAVYFKNLRHMRRHSAHNRTQGIIPSQNGIFNLSLPFLHFLIRHGILLIIGQRFVSLSCRRIVSFLHGIHDFVVFLQEVLYHIVNAVYICGSADGHLFADAGCCNIQSIDGELIALSGKYCAVQNDFRIFSRIFDGKLRVLIRSHVCLFKVILCCQSQTVQHI
ncbi:hypothetical protein IMSAGC013_00907 [Lachnospiraceae bacterium]|nr:hypothetical protein IMSAGC013_00907 [Lachnospiraceae bacterium]